MTDPSEATPTPTADAPPPADTPSKPPEPPSEPPSSPKPTADGEKADSATFDPSLIPEKFDGDLAKFVESHNELERSFFAKRDTIKEEIREEMRAAAPETYETPERLAKTLNADDPVLQRVQNIARDVGLSQEDYARVLEGFYDGVNEFAESEMQLLGDEGPQRVQAVETWLKNVLGADAGENLANAALTTAALVVSVETIMGKMLGNNPLPPSEETTMTDGPSQYGAIDGERIPDSSPQEARAFVRAKMADPRYRDEKQRDANYVKQIDAAFAAIAPGEAHG